HYNIRGHQYFKTDEIYLAADILCLFSFFSFPVEKQNQIGEAKDQDRKCQSGLRRNIFIRIPKIECIFTPSQGIWEDLQNMNGGQIDDRNAIPFFWF
ncbi:hypothetical protein LCGC14_3043280, partial [marine sediment metagenome]